MRVTFHVAGEEPTPGVTNGTVGEEPVDDVQVGEGRGDAR